MGRQPDPDERCQRIGEGLQSRCAGGVGEAMNRHGNLDRNTILGVAAILLWSTRWRWHAAVSRANFNRDGRCGGVPHRPGPT